MTIVVFKEDIDVLHQICVWMDLLVLKEGKY